MITFLGGLAGVGGLAAVVLYFMWRAAKADADAANGEVGRLKIELAASLAARKQDDTRNGREIATLRRQLEEANHALARALSPATAVDLWNRRHGGGSGSGT